MAELKQLNASASGSTRRPAPPSSRSVSRWASGSFQISTLEEELQLIQGLNRSTGRVAGIYPEIKEPTGTARRATTSAPSSSILARYGYKTKTDKVYVQCFDEAEVKRIRTELGYKGRLVQLIEGSRPLLDEHKHLRTAAGLAEVAKVADGIGPALPDVVSRKADGTLEATSLVRDAHAAGLIVHPYTFRADALASGRAVPGGPARAWPFDIGVDGVFTDHPDRAVAFLRKR